MNSEYTKPPITSFIGRRLGTMVITDYVGIRSHGHCFRLQCDCGRSIERRLSTILQQYDRCMGTLNCGEGHQELRNCEFCHKEFMYKVWRGRSNAICDSCRKKIGNGNNYDIVKEEEQRKYNEWIAKQSDRRITADAVAAKKAGVTYGKYKAMQYEEKLKKGLIKREN